MRNINPRKKEGHLRGGAQQGEGRGIGKGTRLYMIRIHYIDA